MTVFYWIAFALVLIFAIPSALYFARYLATGDGEPRFQAVRFFRWSSLVVLATFNITILKHIVLTLADW